MPRRFGLFNFISQDVDAVDVWCIIYSILSSHGICCKCIVVSN